MHIHLNILNRRSIRTFDETGLKDTDLQLLFEAARWAPSSFNAQPWRFVVARKTDNHYNLLFDCLNSKNKEWAIQAPVLILAVAQRTLEYNGQPNYYFMHDTALAFSNLAFQATALNLYTHPMGGFDHDIARRNFSIPEDFEPILCIAVGYNEKYVQQRNSEKIDKERNRMPLEKMVFGSKWEKSYPLD